MLCHCNGVYGYPWDDHGRHAFSSDGIVWQWSKERTFPPALMHPDGTNTSHISRQRPQLVFDSGMVPTHLITGIAVASTNRPCLLRGMSIRNLTPKPSFGPLLSGLNSYTFWEQVRVAKRLQWLPRCGVEAVRSDMHVYAACPQMNRRGPANKMNRRGPANKFCFGPLPTLCSA